MNSVYYFTFIKIYTATGLIIIAGDGRLNCRPIAGRARPRFAGRPDVCLARIFGRENEKYRWKKKIRKKGRNKRYWLMVFYLGDLPETSLGPKNFNDSVIVAEVKMIIYRVILNVCACI